jgi:hypothetical protein
MNSEESLLITPAENENKKWYDCCINRCINRCINSIKKSEKIQMILLFIAIYPFIALILLIGYLIDSVLNDRFLNFFTIQDESEDYDYVFHCLETGFIFILIVLSLIFGTKWIIKYIKKKREN